MGITFQRWPKYIIQSLSLNQYTYEFIVTCMFNVPRTSGSVCFFLSCCVYQMRLDWPCYTHDLPCCRLTRSMFRDNFALFQPQHGVLTLFQPQHGVLTNKDHTIYREITLTLIAFIRLSQLSNSSLKAGLWNDRVTLMNAIGPVSLYPEPVESKPQFYSLRLHRLYKVGQR
jgi:hypothetical protein